MEQAANLAKNVVFYHQSDVDGRMAGAIVRKAILDANSTLEMIPFSYQEIDGLRFNLMYPQAQNVFFVDCSPKKDEAAAIMEGGAKVIIIDHHKTSIEEFGDNAFRQKYAGKLLTYFDTERCGALLAFNYFFPEKEVPYALHLADVYDRWQKGSRDWQKAEYFNNSLMTMEWDASEPMFEPMIFNKNEIHTGLHIKGGKDITQTLWLEYTRIARKSGGTLNWEGVNFFILNTPLGNSKAVGFAPQPGVHQAILLYHFSPHAGKWVVSLYQMADRLHWEGDLSHIAKKYGGGGHAGACGFSCDTLPFSLDLIKPVREVHALFRP